jgi:hypothetical protein
VRIFNTLEYYVADSSVLLQEIKARNAMLDELAALQTQNDAIRTEIHAITTRIGDTCTLSLTFNY